MKPIKIIYLLTTGLIFLFQGLMPILTMNNPESLAMLNHLGYPTYFGAMLVFFKVIGSAILLVPQIPPRFKEWAYVGFGIDFIAALYSIWKVDGMIWELIVPVIAMFILVISNITYYKLHKLNEA